MVYPSIIDRYVFKEIFVSFLFSFAVFFITGLIAGFLPLLQKGMETGSDITLTLFRVLINALPGTLVTIAPLSLTIGILMGLGRMSADNEIAALKSAGVSVVRLLPAALVIGFLAFAVSLVCTLFVIPSAITKGKDLLRSAAIERPEAGIEERVFFDAVDKLIIYVERIDSHAGILHHVFIRETANPDEARTIVAEKGKTAPGGNGKGPVLLLRNGVIIREDKHGDALAGLAFEDYQYRLPTPESDSSASVKTLEELGIAGIMQRVREARLKEKEAKDKEFRDFYHRVELMGRMLVTQRFTHPFACIALALAAFPIGALNMGRSRLNNVSVGLVVMFLYYALTLSAERAARSALAPPEIALAIPGALFVIGSAYLIRKVRLEQLPDPTRALKSAVTFLRANLRTSRI